MGCTMHRIRQARGLALGLCLLAGLAACGPDISSLSDEAAATAAAADAPAVPVLASQPATDVDTVPPGGSVQVTVQATAQRPLDTVTVTLSDGAGGEAGTVTLTPLDAQSWSATLGVPADAAPGSYALDLTLNDGPFVDGGSVLQTLYRFEPFGSTAVYRTYANAIDVEGSTYRVEPLPHAPPGPPLVTVQVGAP